MVGSKSDESPDTGVPSREGRSVIDAARSRYRKWYYQSGGRRFKLSWLVWVVAAFAVVGVLAAVVGVVVGRASGIATVIGLLIGYVLAALIMLVVGGAMYFLVRFIAVKGGYVSSRKQADRNAVQALALIVGLNVLVVFVDPSAIFDGIATHPIFIWAIGILMVVTIGKSMKSSFRKLG